MNNLSIEYEVVENALIGDIITWHGHKYKLTKKTKTAVAVERYYWFNALIDSFLGKGKSND